MTTVSKLFNDLVSELTELYSKEEAVNIMRMVFQEKLGLSRMDMAMEQMKEIDEKSEKLIFNIAEKLIEGEPVQQLMGYTHFYGYKLRLNKHVLIPRPETEELVHWIIQENKGEEPDVLDVGTGSGCIAIALSRGLENPAVKAVDISQQALELAQINSIANNAGLDLMNLDILVEVNWKKLADFDIIVSNPPYVTEGEKSAMHINVLNHEPHLALFVPDQDPLIFYKKISEMAIKHLKKDGRLYFEINAAYGKQVKKLLKDKGFSDIVIRKDLNDKDRFVRAMLH
jgi:release factor glutamine methyltransferase